MDIQKKNMIQLSIGGLFFCLALIATALSLLLTLGLFAGWGNGLDETTSLEDYGLLLVMLFNSVLTTAFAFLFFAIPSFYLISEKSLGFIYNNRIQLIMLYLIGSIFIAIRVFHIGL